MTPRIKQQFDILRGICDNGVNDCIRNTKNESDTLAGFLQLWNLMITNVELTYKLVEEDGKESKEG